MYCDYYQVRVNVRYTWFIGGVFRNDEYIAFERTLDGSNEILEFFVVPGHEKQFFHLMGYLKEHAYVYEVTKMENRLKKKLT